MCSKGSGRNIIPFFLCAQEPDLRTVALFDNVWLTFRRCGPWTEFVWLGQSLFDWQITGHRFFPGKKIN
jgi:hypothetical protein